MPFAPTQLVLAAVNELQGSLPLEVVSVPALLRTAKALGLDPVTQGVPFGSGDETKLLDDYFVLPRPPDRERPWRAPWSASEPWQKRKYPGGGLQRQRTDQERRGRVFVQQKANPAAGRPRDVWRLRPQAGSELLSLTGAKALRLVDLALWMGRDQDVADLDELIDWFNRTFEPKRADLVGTIYRDDVPAEYQNVPFAEEPIDEVGQEALGSLPPAPTVSGTFADLVQRLETRIEAGGYRLPPGLVRRVLSAWLRGDLVVLVGQPGTGKTFFAGLLGRAMEAERDLDTPLLIPVRADFDESEFIGYERLDGTPQLREFAAEILKTPKPLEARVVVLEEFNLASVETYLASLLVAMQEQERLVRLPDGEHSQLPVDTFVIATCNSFRDEPETRTRVSSPTKRRASIITMPNVLADRFEADPQNAVLTLALSIISTERERVDARAVSGQGAQFDALRTAALHTVMTSSDLSDEVRASLNEICTAILTTSVGQSWFTLGLLKDVTLEIVYAERTAADELRALGEAVADKIVHQLRGTHADVEELRHAVAALPNAEEIGRLIDRVMDGPSDELLPLL